MTDRSFNVVATTRRSWSREQKQAIVAEVDAGDATLSDVARRHGIHTSLLFRWRKMLGSVMGAHPLAAATSGSVPSFIPVLLPPPAPASPPKPGAVEIVLANGRTVRVGTDVDAQALAGIVDALEKRR